MKYLKKFENHSQYDAYISGGGAVLPNVSLCVQENEVHYNPYVDPYNGHEYVDLGLPSGTKWATMNVGANSVTDYGNYYDYGKGAATYQETSGTSKYDGIENPLALSADTAAQVWGGAWHMPTSAQCQELISNTYSVWEENYEGSGINGYLFIKGSGRLFIPASGYYDSNFNGLIGINVYGITLTSTPYDSDYIYSLNTESGDRSIAHAFRRSNGGAGSVRPVVG